MSTTCVGVEKGIRAVIIFIWECANNADGKNKISISARRGIDKDVRGLTSTETKRMKQTVLQLEELIRYGNRFY
jgi:hypothetical protein